MTTVLLGLIGEALAAADPKPIWIDEGGRACPHGESEGGWGDTFSGGCSQPVFRLAGTDHYDYGGRGGPGWDWCRKNCEHGHRHRFDWHGATCQEGGDYCAAGRRDGVICADDSCDIDDGIRPKDAP